MRCALSFVQPSEIYKTVNWVIINFFLYGVLLSPQFITVHMFCHKISFICGTLCRDNETPLYAIPTLSALLHTYSDNNFAILSIIICKCVCKSDRMLTYILYYIVFYI